MSDDLELLRLRAKAKLKLKQSEDKDFAPSVEEMEAARGAVEPTTGEAIAGGFIEGVPFMKDAVSAFDGISTAMEDDDVSFDEAYGNYKENLDEINTDLTQAETHAPGSFLAGEIGGTVAALAGGGAALKGAGAGSKLTGLGMSVASGTGVGAAQSLSRSRDRGISDVVVGGAIGATGELVGAAAVKGLKRGGRYLLDKADDIGANAAKRLMGIGNVSSKKTYFKHLKKTNQPESKFLEDVLTQKMKDGDTVVNFSDAPERMLDKVKIRKGDLGEEIADQYKQVDELGGEVDLYDLKDSLRDDVVSPFLHSDDPGMNKIGVELDEYIGKIGQRSKGVKKEVSEEGTKIIEDISQDDKWGVSRVWKLQKDIRKRIEGIYKKNGLDMSASKEQQRKVATSLGNSIDDIMENMSVKNSELGNDFFAAIKKKRLQFGNMATIEESVEANMFRSKDDPVSLIKEALGVRSLVISGAATSAIGPAGLVAGPMLNKIVQSPKTPLYLAQGLNKIGTVMSAAPTGEVAAKLNSAALMNNKKFKDSLYGVVGDLNLKQEPLARSMESVVARQNDIRHVIKDQQPSLLADFEKVMKSGDPDQIGALMDQVSKFPGADVYFEPGIGIGGKVYSPEDKAILERQLKMSDVPAAQRVQMANELRSNGVIPDFDSVVRPLPKKHVPRTKKSHDY